MKCIVNKAYKIYSQSQIWDKIVKYEKKVLSIIFIFYPEKVKKYILGILTTVLALLGFLFSIGNDYFSQYDYDIKKILNSYDSYNRIFYYSDISSVIENTIPKYYFILDVSESINTKELKTEVTENLKKISEDIRNSGYCDNGTNNFEIKDNTKFIPYCQYLQLQLMHALKELYNSHKNDFDYSIVKFSNNPQIVPTKDITESFKTIDNEDFKGGKTNFIGLLGCLQDNILSSVGPSNNYKRREINLVFFSDFLHDDGLRYPRKDLENKVLSFLKTMSEKNIDIQLFYSKDYFDKKSYYKSYSIFDLFSSSFPRSKIGILDIDDGLLSCLISKKPIPIYFNNSLYEEELKAKIDFGRLNGKKTLSFGIQQSSLFNDSIKPDYFIKQEYYLINGCDTIHLSGNLQEQEIKPTDNVTLMIKGYIPAPYLSQDFVIQDNEEGIKSIIPVAFYNEFPFTGIIILISMALLLMFVVLYVIIIGIELLFILLYEIFHGPSYKNYLTLLFVILLLFVIFQFII